MEYLKLNIVSPQELNKKLYLGGFRSQDDEIIFEEANFVLKLHSTDENFFFIKFFSPLSENK